MGNALWLDLDSRGNIADGHACSAETLARRSGLNLGNLVFRRALQNLVDLSEAAAVDYSGALQACDRRRPERLIVSAANWLSVGANAERDNDFRRRLFAQAECPITVFGLGVQWSGVGKPRLGPLTLGLARLLSERSAVIGVRDDLTREVLGDAGIGNVVVAGCPSNFLNLDPGLGSLLKARARRLFDLPRRQLRLHLTESSGGHAASSAVRAAILALLRDGSAFHVVQSPELLGFLLGETARLPTSYSAHAEHLGLAESDLGALVRDRSLHFSSVDAWMDFARTCDLSAGMRIHGTMVALQAGVPSLLVAHDSRTDGLGRTMGLPRIAPEDFVPLARAGFSGVAEVLTGPLANYGARRRLLAAQMLQVVQRNGLTPTAAFLRFCTAADPSTEGTAPVADRAFGGCTAESC